MHGPFLPQLFSVVPRPKVKLVAKMLKAIHAQESKVAARKKAAEVVKSLWEMKLKEAAKKVEDCVEETLTYANFPFEHWTRIRTNNALNGLTGKSDVGQEWLERSLMATLR